MKARVSLANSLSALPERSLTKKYSIQGVWIGIVFTLGMAFVFFIFGMIISSVGIFIEVSTIFYLITGIILIVLGINILKPLKELIKSVISKRKKRIHTQPTKSSQIKRLDRKTRRGQLKKMRKKVIY